MISHVPIVLGLQISFVDLILEQGPLAWAVLILLLAASVFSWAIIIAKWRTFKAAEATTARFLRAFRKAPSLDAMVVALEQFRPCPLAAVFDTGYEEAARQIKQRGTISNRMAMERSLQLGVSQEVDRLEEHLNWLATIAAVSPFVGLFGTVWGIINAFQGLGLAGAVSLRAVAPGISEALLATAMGLGAAIPAAIFYNLFGARSRRLGGRMEDFALEFMNLVERDFER